MNIQNEKNTEDNENKHRKDLQTDGHDSEGDLLETLPRRRIDPVDRFVGIRCVMLRKKLMSGKANDTPNQIARNHQQTHNESDQPDQTDHMMRIHRHVMRLGDDRVTHLHEQTDRQTIKASVRISVTYDS